MWLARREICQTSSPCRSRCSSLNRNKMSLFAESVKNANTAFENWAKVIDFFQGAQEPGGEKFNRLLFNPADRLEGKNASDEHPSPLMNWLMNKFGFNAKGQKE